MRRAAIALAFTASACAKAPAREGIERDDRLPALRFDGFADRNDDGVLGKGELGPVTEAELFRRSPRLPEAARWLLVHTAFVWCGHCAFETEEEKKLVARSKGQVRVVQIVLADEFGEPAGDTVLQRWVDARRSSLPTVREPIPLFAKRYGRAPTFILVDLNADRRVTYVGEGPRGYAEASRILGDRSLPAVE